MAQLGNVSAGVFAAQGKLFTAKVAAAEGGLEQGMKQYRDSRRRCIVGIIASLFAAFIA